MKKIKVLAVHEFDAGHEIGILVENDSGDRKVLERIKLPFQLKTPIKSKESNMLRFVFQELIDMRETKWGDIL